MCVKIDIISKIEIDDIVCDDVTSNIYFQLVGFNCSNFSETPKCAPFQVCLLKLCNYQYYYDNCFWFCHLEFKDYMLPNTWI